MDKTHRIDAVGAIAKGLLGFLITYFSLCNAQQTGYHLQIVLHPVMDFFNQQFDVAVALVQCFRSLLYFGFQLRSILFLCFFIDFQLADEIVLNSLFLLIAYTKPDGNTDGKNKGIDECSALKNIVGGRNRFECRCHLPGHAGHTYNNKTGQEQPAKYCFLPIHPVENKRENDNLKYNNGPLEPNRMECINFEQISNRLDHNHGRYQIYPEVEYTIQQRILLLHVEEGL